MINMAVLNLKDIVKYLIKITLVIAVVIGLTKYLSTAKVSIEKKADELGGVSFTSCLDVTIPGMESSKQDEKTQEMQISPLEKMLYLNLGMLNSLKDKSITKKAEEDKKQTNEGQEDEKQDVDEPLQKAETGLETEVQKTNVPEKYTSEYKGVKIRNETKYKLTEEILTPDVTVKKENILIFHTHTCESYTPSEKYQYKQTGNYRTTDKNFSVVRVGRELDRQLQNYGYKVTHSETYHDYPSYTGSYENSYKTVTNLLQKNKNTDIVIDLHRDAISDYSYAPTVKIGDEYAAQLMFVIGGNVSKEHPNWQQNLKFAVKIQQKANEMYPGLFKPIILRYASYNQQTAKGASIIEVGSTGNTMEQALTSMKYLAKVMDEVLKK